MEQRIEHILQQHKNPEGTGQMKHFFKTSGALFSVGQSPSGKRAHAGGAFRRQTPMPGRRQIKVLPIVDTRPLQ